MKRLSRRTMLRGLTLGVGAQVALPMLDVMLDSHGAAYADGAPLPIRLGIWFWGCGNLPNRWNPKQSGAGYTLSEQLAPLADNRDYVTVLSGLYVKGGGTPGHHTGRAAVLTASYDPNNGTYGNPIDPSIDQVMAKEWAGKTRLPSLEVGVSRSGPNCGCDINRATAVSGPGTFLPSEQDPKAVFDRLFATSNGSAEASKLLAAQKSVLDAVLDDAKALQATLPSKDKQRLESHLQGIRELEGQLKPSACSTPTDPGRFPKQDGKEQITAINRAMVDLVTVALACDLTRAFNFAFSQFQCDSIFWEAGLNEQLHAMTHDLSKVELVNKGLVFSMSQLNVFLTKLRNTPEGAGNLLDNCCIYASSDTSDASAHSVDDLPVLLMGKAGGKLRSGYHYRAPGAPKGKPIGAALLTALRAVGSQARSIGKNADYTEEILGDVLM